MAEIVYNVEAQSIQPPDGSDPTHYAVTVIEYRVTDEGKIQTTKHYVIKQPVPVAEFKTSLRFQPAKLIELWQAEQGEVKRSPGRPAKGASNEDA